jgi:hypothetical protein
MPHGVLMRKAQLQIMENIFVLIILFVILAISLIFVIGFQKTQYNAKLEELKELELIKKSQILSFLPEMQCTTNQDIEADCYDILKIEAFTQQIQTNPDYYNPLLGNIRIEIKRLNPSPGIPESQRWDKEWLVYDNALQGSIFTQQVPVLLRNATANKDYFGVIFLEVYG